MKGFKVTTETVQVTTYECERCEMKWVDEADAKQHREEDHHCHCMECMWRENAGCWFGETGGPFDSWPCDARLTREEARKYVLKREGHCDEEFTG